MIAAAATSTASNVAGAAFSQVLMSIVMGNFNPEYNKEARKRMRYIQQKYSLAYEGGKAGEDPCGIISKIDPNSKLLMDAAGKKPANPFPDERAWEDSLVTNFHPVSGHQGRTIAGTCKSLPLRHLVLNNPTRNRKRAWVPGVSTPGRPNDYINLFLEETKTWLRTQLSLDTVAAEELKKREKFYSNLKHDNYYWCFPNEFNSSKNIYQVIDYIHDKIKNAYDIISREEMNKSLQLLFKELNDHTTNFFEFSKIFLAYLLSPSKKMGDNIMTSSGYDGNSIETGKLHYLLTRVTSIVFETYQKDLELTNQRLSSGNRVTSSSSASSPTGLTVTQSYSILVKGYEKTSLPLTSTAYLMQVEDPKQTRWIVKKTWSDFEAFHDLLIKELAVYLAGTSASSSAMLRFPSKDKRPSQYQQFLNPNDYHDATISLLNPYCEQLAACIFQYQYYPKIQKIIAQFLDTKYLINPVALLPSSNPSNALMIPNGAGSSLLNSNPSQLVYAESIPNIFVVIKQQYQNHLLQSNNSAAVTFNTTSSPSTSRFSTSAILGTIMNRKPSITADSKSDSKENESNEIIMQGQGLYNIFEEFTSKEWSIFQRIWGPEFGLKIINAYSLLQRIATILGWTLEINHFFISMFGNTLSFSKLPLHDIITTQKELIQQFMTLSNELYTFICKINEENSYKFHKNLQMTENELQRLIYHGNKIINIIQIIEKDHLDYDAQMKRLKDCHERFQPFLYRIGNSLLSIQNELQLNIPNYTFNDKNLISSDMKPMLLMNSSLAPADEKEMSQMKDFSDVEVVEEILHGRRGRSTSGGNTGVESKQNGEEKESNAIGGGERLRKNQIKKNVEEDQIESNPAYAIFSRSSSETIRPAIDHPNPLVTESDTPVFTAESKKESDRKKDQSKAGRTRSEDVDEELKRMNVQFVRNEESSAVCVIM